MKKSIPSLLFVLLNFMTVSHCVAQPNPVPNPGFENWFSVEHPDGWSPVVPWIPTSPTSQSTDAHSGSSAVKGEVMQEGPSDWQPPQLTATFPINFRPLSFEGWYKYYRAARYDVLRFQVVFKKKAKTIGFASWADSVSTTEYKHFFSPIAYSDTTLPDSATILLTITNNSGQTYNSYYIVDDLALTNNTGPLQIYSLTLAGSPNLSAGSSVAISWNTTGILSNPIDIDMSFDGRQTWTAIQHGLDSSVRSINWTTPSANVTGAVIRVSSGGLIAYSSPFNIVMADVTYAVGVEGFTIAPNPASTNTTVSFDLISSAGTKLILFDGLGREVYRSDEVILFPGHHEIRFSTSGLASGAYQCKVLSGSNVYQRRIDIVR